VTSIWKLIGLAAIAGIPLRAQTIDPPSRYDGKWWLAVSQIRRVGFIDGYADCSVADAKNKKLGNVSPSTFEPKVTKYFTSAPSNFKIPASKALQSLALEEPVAKYDPFAEHYPDKHGYYDGDYWRMMEPDHRLGLVEGLLACYVPLDPTRWRYSKPPRLYVGEISAWYGVKENDPAEINEQRYRSKIADVLYRFRDNSGPGSKKTHTGK